MFYPLGTITMESFNFQEASIFEINMATKIEKVARNCVKVKVSSAGHSWHANEKF